MVCPQEGLEYVEGSIEAQSSQGTALTIEACPFGSGYESMSPSIRSPRPDIPFDLLGGVRCAPSLVGSPP